MLPSGGFETVRGGGTELNDVVQLLWNLQIAENEAREISDILTRMPRDLDRAREELSLRDATLKKREAEHQAQLKARRELERQVGDFETKLRDNLTRQGGAKTNAELDAFKREASFIREQKSGVETRILEMFDEEEGLNGRIAEARALVDAAKAQAEEKARAIEARAANDRAELARRRAECDRLAAGLPGPIQSRFQQLLKAKNGVAVATVVRGACGGCFNALPPQLVNEARKGESAQICESCGRMLVWMEGVAG